jgi:ABC-type Fe3+ transport system permease subunit
VVPLDVLTLGIASGQLTDYDSEYSFGGGGGYVLAYFLLATPLITAGHVTAVIDIGAGRKPSVGESLARAGQVLLPLIGALLLAALGMLLGFLALVIPGIYLYVRWYVTAQSIVAERRGPIDGLSRSWELAQDNWWRLFGISIVIGLISGLLSALFGLPISLLADEYDSGPLLVLGTIVSDAAVLSFTALAATLVFFDLRARHEPSPTTDATPDPTEPLDRPEAPPAY